MNYSSTQKDNYAQLKARLNKYTLLVQNVFDKLNGEAAKIALSTGYNGEEGKFSFNDYPITLDAVNRLRTEYTTDIGTIIMTGTAKEWKNSNIAQDLLADGLLSKYTGEINRQKYEIYYQTNSDALKAFQKRVDKGMHLSEKIWEQSEGYIEGLEAAISTGIEKGTSAVTLSKIISKYLSDFPSLKQDYKEKYGEAAHIKDCEYRAARLARSEINMSYRQAEHERWMQMDFVVGKKIQTTQNGKHENDMCDMLAGDYPKDFIWDGWHTNCMCYATPILKTEDEFFNESEYSTSSVNEITDVPYNFKEWIVVNEGRIAEAKSKGTVPYFINNNEGYVQSARETFPTLSKALARHDFRTDMEIEDIKRRAKLRQNMNEYQRERLAYFRKTAKQLGIDISDYEQDLEYFSNSPDEAMSWMDHYIWQRGGKLERLMKNFDRHMNRSEEDIAKVQQMLDARNFDKFVKRQQDAAKMLVKAYRDKFGDISSISPRAFDDFLNNVDHWTPQTMIDKWKELFDKEIETLKRLKADTFPGTKELWNSVVAMRHGGKFYGEGFNGQKIVGIDFIETKYKENFANVIGKPSLSTTEAIRKCRALMPRAVVVDFGKFGNDVWCQNIVDGMTKSIYNNLNYSPEIEKTIQMVGTNLAQYERVKKAYGQFLFNETDIFHNLSESERIVEIEKCLSSRDYIKAKIKEFKSAATYWDKKAKSERYGSNEWYVYESNISKCSVRASNLERWKNEDPEFRYVDNAKNVYAWADPFDGDYAYTQKAGIIGKYNPKTKGILVSANNDWNDLSWKHSYSKDVQTEFHPKGTDQDPYTAIFDHEYGHKIVEHLRICKSDIATDKVIKDAIQYYKAHGGLEASLSRYAKKNDNETIAEAWAEYLSSSSPRMMSLDIGRRIEELLGIYIRRKRP